MTSPFVLETHGLEKTVPIAHADKLTILHPTHFAVRAGESVAIVGASGSGKSTLLGLLAGLDTPTAGQVKLLGEDIFQYSEDERARLRGRALGFVFQSFQLLPALTALENVMLPLELAGKAGVAETAQRWLTRVGLGERADHTPKQLSGGEQQRVALARAFAPAPQLLLADEPTGNLDAETGLQIIDLLFELNQSTGTTLILVTHDNNLARRCQRTVRMQAGRLLDDV